MGASPITRTPTMPLRPLPRRPDPGAPPPDARDSGHLSLLERIFGKKKREQQHDNRHFTKFPRFYLSMEKRLLGGFVGIAEDALQDYSVARLQDLAYTKMLSMRAFSPAEERLLESVGGLGPELRKQAQSNSGLSLAEESRTRRPPSRPAAR